MENQLIPYSPSQLPACQHPIIFAPHPDDEVFGAGGALALYRLQGLSPQIIVVTDGGLGEIGAYDRQSLVNAREQESCLGAAVLNLHQPIFWRLGDRTLSYGEALVARVEQAIIDLNADVVLAPALSEMHPDHRYLAMAVIESIRRMPKKPTLLMYEVGVPMPAPNFLLDITSVMEQKRRAMGVFSSQLGHQNYLEQIAALNTFRSYTLGKDVKAVEAFRLWDAASHPFLWSELYESEYQRQHRIGMPLCAKTDLPLVSILIRSMDRPTLETALNSISIQTYSNIEVVVINASGRAHTPLGNRCGNFPLQLISLDEQGITGSSQALGRAAAANLALDSAKGAWLLFIDDDDWILPDHVGKLLRVALKHRDALAIHTGIDCIFPDGQPVGITFDHPVDQVMLRAGNQLPIHGVLFSAKLLEVGCRFDTALDLYEDWDFWLQVARQTDFLYAPGISGYYVMQGNSGVHQQANARTEAQVRIFRKWQTVRDLNDEVEMMAWIQQAVVDRLQARKTEQSVFALEAKTATADELSMQLRHEIAVISGQSLEKDVVLADLVRENASLKISLANTSEQLISLSLTLNSVYSSTSWRILGGIRKIVDYFRH